jgi:hypothetical protein
VVLLTRRTLLIADLLEDPRLLQTPQPVDQQAARQPDPALELLEAMNTLERQIQDHQRPAIAQDIERPRGGIGLNELGDRPRGGGFSLADSAMSPQASNGPDPSADHLSCQGRRKPKRR